MSEEVSHQECPFIKCGSSDAFSYNSAKKVGSCHACKGAYPSRDLETFGWAKDTYPVGTWTKPDESVDGDLFKRHRGVTRDTMEFYGIVTRGDTHRYPYPGGGVKVRNLVKKAFHGEALNPKEMFGRDKFTSGSSKRLTITEGELDAASAYQMLLDKGSRWVNPVVSLPGATPSSKFWENNKDWIDSFEKIIISFDNDDAGDALSDKVARLFPGKVYRIDHGSLKDANEFLTNGKVADFKAAWWTNKRYTPKNVMNSSEEFLSLFKDTPDHTYEPTGIVDLDGKIKGLMQGHFTVIKAETGIGKTEVMRLLEYNLLKRGVKIAAWHLEEVKLRSLLGLVSYELQDNVTRKDLIVEKELTEEVEGAIVSLTDAGNFFQFFLSDGDGGDELCRQIRFFAEACDCRFVFFEPIQDVVVGSSEEGKESLLADLSIRLSKLAVELNVGIVTIAHTNENGDPKYCKMIGQRASVIINLHRDKESDDLRERNTTHLTVQKNRPCSDDGPAGRLLFDMDKFTLSEG